MWNGLFRENVGQPRGGHPERPALLGGRTRNGPITKTRCESFGGWSGTGWRGWRRPLTLVVTRDTLGPLGVPC